MRERPSVQALALYFLRLGLTGFGGPVALASYIRRDLAEHRSWIAEDEYEEGLAIATACPGPLAYKLGIYCGFIAQGIPGAIAVAIAFAAAPFAIVVALGALYARFGSALALRALFYGIGPVVIAIIARACWDLGRKTLRSQWTAYAFAGIACATTIVVQRELVALFVGAGLLGIFVFYGTAPPRATPREPQIGIGLLSASTALTMYQNVAASKLFWFFFKTGLFVFGSGLVIVPFLKTYVVDQYHWLSNQAFLDAVAVGIVSPGPVVVTATFVGYLTHGLTGAFAATVGIFTPSLVFVVLGTPLLRRHRQNARLQGFIRGITVAIVGVLLGTSFLVARTTVHDALGFAILLVSLVALWPTRRVPEPVLIAGGGIVGLVAVLAAGMRP